MNPSLAHDLALKRATKTAPDSRPHFAWRECVPTDAPLLPEILLLVPQGETRFDLGEIADTLGKAVTNVHLARGDKSAIFTAETRAFVSRIVREVAANLAILALRQSPLRISLNDLYELIEKTLVDNNAYDVAKSLLLNRSNKLGPVGGHAAAGVRVIRRNNHVVPYIDQKVEIAVRKAFLSLQRDSTPAVEITKAVTARILGSRQSFVHIEEIQDVVQEELMKAGHYKVAEAYILYRALRNEQRTPAGDVGEASETSPAELPVSQPSMIMVRQLNGENVFWDRTDLRKRIEFASIGLELCLTPEQIETELLRSVFDQIAQKDLDATIILNSKTLIERDADFAKFAGRIQLTYIYQEVLGWDIVRDGVGKLKEFHRHALRPYLERGAAIKRLNPRLLEYDLEKLAAALDPSADLEFDFLGVQTLYDRYLIIDKTVTPPRRLETPQLFWLRVSMGLFLDEPGDREARVAALYSLYKSRRFCSSTPTL
ncbi:MAG TPA: ATP cone domain-containing protein, partial [Candidatus Synoicihabitans sp.]|nr:ATP cone domain-containing protein [Candidatus Synoicihabitans sp.]